MSSEPRREEQDHTVESLGRRQELDRRLSMTELVVYGLVFMVPIAPFAIGGSVFAASGGMVPLAYIVGLVAMLFTANSYAQTAKALLVSRSVYSYAGRGSPSRRFGLRWMILLDYIFVPTLLYLASAIAMTAIIPAIPAWAWLTGFVLSRVINYFRVLLAARSAMVRPPDLPARRPGGAGLRVDQRSQPDRPGDGATRARE